LPSYCIICGKEKKGREVDEDYIIKGIRWFKRNITKNEKGNKLVVCNECYPKYLEYRKKFERRQITYILLGSLFLIFGLIISPTLGTLFVGLGLLLFLYLLSLLNYMPKLKENKKDKQIYTLTKK
jgi:hypothetical protein